MVPVKTNTFLLLSSNWPFINEAATINAPPNNAMALYAFSQSAIKWGMWRNTERKRINIINLINLAPISAPVKVFLCQCLPKWAQICLRDCKKYYLCAPFSKLILESVDRRGAIKASKLFQLSQINMSINPGKSAVRQKDRYFLEIMKLIYRAYKQMTPF